MEITKIKGESFERNSAQPVIDHISDDSINAKYMKGETRLVTEQARYPLRSLVSLFSDANAYVLQPGFQRRKRWDDEKKSKLIESFIINVPVPPVFLYEVDYASFEVMDGLQRITTIIDFYEDKFTLTGLNQWCELNGMKYSELPEKIKEGIDRRYLSSIILLNESASDPLKANAMKQLVFERLNTGGVKLSPQEIRNAIYNGKMNQLCIKLSSDQTFRELWNICEDESTGIQSNKLYKDMSDVELVLRFFAMRFVEKYTGKLDNFLDEYLQEANEFSDETLLALEGMFLKNIKIALKMFGNKAFKVYKTNYGVLSWSSEPQRTIYDPMMIALTNLNLSDERLLEVDSEDLNKKLEYFYKEHEDAFDGKKQSKGDIISRATLIYDFLYSYIMN